MKGNVIINGKPGTLVYPEDMCVPPGYIPVKFEGYPLPDNPNQYVLVKCGTLALPTMETFHQMRLPFVEKQAEN